MQYSGRCLCNAISYELTGEPHAVAICHCRDCQRSAGAPLMAWAMFPEAALTLKQGTPKTINSSGAAMRSFCADCGTGMFYRNAEVLPGVVDIQVATLDHPNSLPPTLQMQTAERLEWVKQLHELPEIERFPD